MREIVEIRLLQTIIVILLNAVNCKDTSSSKGGTTNDVSTVTLKSLTNTSLCVRAEPHGSNNEYLSEAKLAECSSKSVYYDVLEHWGDSQLTLLTLLGEYHQIYPTTGEYCFEVTTKEKYSKISLTSKCDNMNSEVFWSFRKISDHRILWMNLKTLRCVRASKISVGAILKMVVCNKTDPNQIWEPEFLPLDWKWEDAGEITMHPAHDQSLCFSSNLFDTQNDLITCSKSSNQNNVNLELGRVSEGNYLQIRTKNEGDSSSDIYGICLYPRSSINSSINAVRIFTEDCNYNSKVQHWKFIPIPSNDKLVQVYNKEREKCMGVADDLKIVVLANCNNQDSKQMWKLNYVRATD